MDTTLAITAPPAGIIDFTRCFIAEELTPLFHVPAYDELPVAARRRYNQLHAFYFNEQVAFFEQEMLSPALGALLRRKDLPAVLAGGVRTFFEEEQRHTAMFRALNLRCAPDLYRDGPYRFIPASPAGRRLLRAVAGRSAALPLVLWLALLQEERSLFYSKHCLNAGLEEHFTAVHRAHLADEVGHVGWDEELLDWLWPRTGPAQRAATARIFAWMVGEFFHLPKRSGRRVVEQLAREFPALDASALLTQLEQLGTNSAFLRINYSRRIAPRSFARFDTHPEFALLAQTLTSYPAPYSPAR